MAQFRFTVNQPLNKDPLRFSMAMYGEGVFTPDLLLNPALKKFIDGWMQRHPEIPAAKRFLETDTEVLMIFQNPLEARGFLEEYRQQGQKLPSIETESTFPAAAAEFRELNIGTAATDRGQDAVRK